MIRLSFENMVDGKVNATKLSRVRIIVEERIIVVIS